MTKYKFLADLSTSAANISAHYDIGNLMYVALRIVLSTYMNADSSFQTMLSEDMNYSSAIFLDYKEDLVKAPELCETLEDAQLRKMK